MIVDDKSPYKKEIDQILASPVILRRDDRWNNIYHAFQYVRAYLSDKQYQEVGIVYVGSYIESPDGFPVTILENDEEQTATKLKIEYYKDFQPVELQGHLVE